MATPARILAKAKEENFTNVEALRERIALPIAAQFVRRVADVMDKITYRWHPYHKFITGTITKDVADVLAKSILAEINYQVDLSLLATKEYNLESMLNDFEADIAIILQRNLKL
jgi:hypothetical protein